MASVAITQNFNDTLENPLPAGTNPIPAGTNPIPVTNEFNAGFVIDSDFDGTRTTKKYGKASSTEARFLQRRLMGY